MFLLKKIKTDKQVRYHLTPSRMAITKKTTDKMLVSVWIKGTLVGGNVNWYSHYEKQYGGS